MSDLQRRAPSRSAGPPLGPPRLSPPKPTTPPAAPPTAPSAPAATAPAKSRLPHPFDAFLGTRVVVTTHSPAIIEGDLIELREGMLVFTNCRVVGAKHVATVDRLVLVTRMNISHINSVPTSIAPVEEPRRGTDR